MRGKVAPGVGSGRRPQGKCQQRSRNGLPGVGMMLLPPQIGELEQYIYRVLLLSQVRVSPVNIPCADFISVQDSCVLFGRRKRSL